MDFVSVKNTVVFVGEGFSPNFFDLNNLKQILGDPIQSKMIVTPIFAQYFYKSGYEILIAPDRVHIAFNKKTLLSDELKKITDEFSKKIENLPQKICTAFGMNYDVVISKKKLGLSALDYCKEKFISDDALVERLDHDEFLANLTKFIYRKGNIRYTLEFEPHFASGGEDLIVKLNAHQDVTDEKKLPTAVGRYYECKEYVKKFHENYFKGENDGIV